MSDKLKDIFEWGYCIVIALVLAILFRYFIGTPTIVKHRSMFPTLKENQRLILDRTFRITKRMPQRGEIITFEAPSKEPIRWEVDQSNPKAIYDREINGIFNKFVYNCLELTKTSYIKRVIALPGEHVKIENGKVYINGNELEEEYLGPDVITKSEVYNDFIVPEGYIFGMGDNRPHSTDCRDLGCIPLDKVEGIVRLRFWPFDAFGVVK